MAVLYTPHFVQFVDNNGDPLNGGKLFTYEAGTVTPKATFTTEAGDVPNANPVVLDSTGRSVVFLDGSYKFRLEEAVGRGAATGEEPLDPPMPPLDLSRGLSIKY